jgi:hypothetical protein
VVRGLAAVLGLLALAQVYFLIAPELPIVSHDDDTAIILAFTVGTAWIFTCVACVVPISDSRPLLVLMVAGALGMVVGHNVADVGAAATPIEAIGYGGFGALFAVGLLAPSLALALPAVVAGVDAISLFAGGPAEKLGNQGITQTGDPLSLETPDWGTGLPAGRLGLSDAVFAGVFLVYARRFGLRPIGTAVGMWLGAVCAIVLQVSTKEAMPALPFMAAGYFLANVDRLPALLRLASRG